MSVRNSGKSKSDQTRARILDAAAHVLATRGYAATTLNLIAERANTKAGSIYYHFASKDELLLEVLEAGTQTAHEAVSRALGKLEPDPDPIGAIQAAIEAHLVAVLSQGPYTTANIRSYGQLPEHLAAAHREVQRNYGTTWRKLIAAAVDAGALRNDLDQRTTRLLLLGAMNWSIEWFDNESTLTPTQLAAQLCDTVINGLRRPTD